MRHHLSYVGTTIFAIVLGFGLYLGYIALPHWVFAVIGMIEFVSVALAIPVFLGIHLHAIHLHQVQLGPVKRAARRVTAKKERE
jgi:hypothetical protein